MKTLEGDVQTAVIQYLAMRHDVKFCMVMTRGKLRGAGGRMYTLGKLHPDMPVGEDLAISDVVGMMDDGRLLVVEVKRPGERPTDAQYRFMYLVAMSGGVAFWANSVAQVPVFMRISNETRAAK